MARIKKDFSPPEPKETGRPTFYTDQLAAEICERLAEGEPLAVICRDSHMPSSVVTVWQWAKDRPSLSESIAKARESGWDHIAWKVRKTARGKLTYEGGDSTGDIQRDKLIIDTDLKLLAKWDPKRYGDKVALTGGSKDDAPIKVETAAKLDNLTREQLDQLLSLATAADAARGDLGGDSEEGD